MIRGDPKCDPKHYLKTAMYPDYQESPHIYTPELNIYPNIYAKYIWIYIQLSFHLPQVVDSWADSKDLNYWKMLSLYTNWVM